MAAAIFYFPLPGTPAAEGNQIRFYRAGTSTPLAVYTDSALSVAWVQPIVLNSAAETTGPIYVSQTPAYKVAYTDRNGVAIVGYPVDNVSPFALGA